MTQKRSPWRVTIASAVHQGPWMEDSYQMITVFWLQVASPEGIRYDHFKTFEVYGVTNNPPETAQTLYNRVMQAIIFDGFTPEGKPEVWSETQPVYGSEAYQRSGGDRAWHSDIEPALYDR